MKPHETNTRALVFGGGGVAGVAWELGILLGLYESGADVRNANLLIGTSAGSVVGAQIATENNLDNLFAAQLTQETKERMVEVDKDQMARAFEKAITGSDTGPKAIRARIGALALTAPTITEAERKEIIQSRLPIQIWPERPLLIVAVNTENGEEYIIDRTSGVSLVDAVAASCAVPGIWPPTTIAGRRYMDGGVRSATNADLATGHKRVLILNPLGANANFFGNGPAAEAANLEREGSQVLIIEPDTASTDAIGKNSLDPATRGPSARAGYAQAKAIASTVAAFWSPS